MRCGGSDEVYLKTGVTAKMLSGKSLTSKIAIKVKAPGAKGFVSLTSQGSQNYCFDKAGVYTIEYSVANPNKAKAVTKKTMTVTVTPKPVSPDDGKATPDDGQRSMGMPQPAVMGIWKFM